jgi:hypothetical protein
LPLIQHHIGLERRDTLDVQRGAVADLLHMTSLLRIIAVGRRPHQLGTPTGSEQQFGQMRRETDDALHRRVEQQLAAPVVVECHLRRQGSHRQ